MKKGSAAFLLLIFSLFPFDLSFAVGNPTIEKGKALFESGQYMAALGEFMTVLRNEPTDLEARRYLRLVVDAMRQSPLGATGNLKASKQAAVADKAVQEQLRSLIRKRSILTLDLKAIPGVTVTLEDNLAQVAIDSGMLFATGSGGLKEGGIPVLDRVSAWLKTFGEQPIIVHLYPEELQDPSKNGGMFLRRYSEIYGFFVEERKIDPKRFVSADLLKNDALPAVEISSTVPKVVIETFGSQTSLLENMPSVVPRHQISRWLEFSIEASKAMFSPSEGEWVNLDIAALTRTGLKDWSFVITPAKGGTIALKLEGKENVLRRLSWDGRHEKGGFMPAGAYRCLLKATDNDGKVMSREITIRIMNTGSLPLYATTPAASKQIARKKSPTKKTKKPTRTPAEPPTAATPSAPAADPAVSDEGGDSQAIWKQVIQFDAGSSEIQPSLKASLERIAKTLEVYPLQKVRIVGFAGAAEPDAETLARARAEAIRAALVNEYKVDPQRVMNAGGRTTPAPDSSKVELSITN